MEINRLRYFGVVVEAGRLRAAAQLLRMSPGALSKALRVLEAEVGFPLLIASGRGLTITDQGMELYRRSRALLTEHTQLIEAMSPSVMGKSFPRKVRIGSFEVFTTYFLTHLIRDKFAQDQEPALVHELTPGHIEQALLDRQIDLGITYIPLPNEALDFLEVASFENGIYGRREVFGKTPPSELPFVVPTTPVDHPAAIYKSLDGWPDGKFPRKIRYEFQLLETALQVSREGLAVVHCPDFIVRLHNRTVKPQFELQKLAFPKGFKPRKSEIYLVKRRSDIEGTLAKKIASSIRMVCK